MMDTQKDNQTAEMNSDISSKPETQISVGQTLRATREAMGLSVNDVANRIKFASRQIESLEADDYGQLPESAFLRGFIRSYARFLNIDPARLLSGLPSSHLKTSSVLEIRSEEIPIPNELSGARRYNIMLLSVGLVIALSVAIYERMHDGVPEVAEPAANTIVQPLELPDVTAGGASAPLSGQEQVPVPAPQQAVRAAPVPAPVAQPSAPKQPVRAAPEARQAPQPVAQQIIRAEPAAGLSPAAAPVVVEPPKPNAVTNAVEHALRLEFDEDSWVEVKDGNDKILTSRMHTAGSLVRVTGKAPLLVIIGNARAVRLFDNGKQVNLDRFTAAEVARITLK